MYTERERKTNVLSRSYIHTHTNLRHRYHQSSSLKMTAVGVVSLVPRLSLLSCNNSAHDLLSGGSKVIRRIIAGKEGEPGNEGRELWCVALSFAESQRHRLTSRGEVSCKPAICLDTSDTACTLTYTWVYTHMQ